MSRKQFIAVIDQDDRSAEQIEHFNQFISVALIEKMGR